MIRWLTALALVVLVAGCASTPPTEAADPPARPLASEPVPSATGSAASAPTRLSGFARRLVAGSYEFDQALPHVTFSVPRGWFLDAAMPRHFIMRPESTPAEDSFAVWYDMHLASTDPTCPEAPRSGVGASAGDLLGGFTGHPGVSATEPRSISIGGLDGHVFDVALASTWSAACPFSEGNPTVPLFVDDNVDGEPAFWGVGGGERMRMIVLDDRHASSVVITIDSAGGATLDALAESSMPVLETFEFEFDVMP